MGSSIRLVIINAFDAVGKIKVASTVTAGAAGAGHAAPNKVLRTIGEDFGQLEGWQFPPKKY